MIALPLISVLLPTSPLSPSKLAKAYNMFIVPEGGVIKPDIGIDKVLSS